LIFCVVVIGGEGRTDVFLTAVDVGGGVVVGGLLLPCYREAGGVFCGNSGPCLFFLPLIIISINI